MTQSVMTLFTVLADVYHEEELVTKEEAEKVASDVGKWREIAVTKDAATATRIAGILDVYEMSIEAKHIQGIYVLSTKLTHSLYRIYLQD